MCTTRGDDGEPRGFHARVRAPDIPCEVLDQSRDMGIEVTRRRRNGCAVVGAPSVPWRPLSPETSTLFKGQTPTLGGLPSVACEVREGDQITITVHASAGPGFSPGTIYEGYIVTTPSHLVEDIGAFEKFLQNVSIGSAARAQAD